LFLVGFALLVRDQVDRAKGYWYDKVQVSVFLCYNEHTPKCPAPATEAQKAAIESALQGLPQVAQNGIHFESHEQAEQRAQALFKGSPALQAAATAQTLPESFRVKLKDPT